MYIYIYIYIYIERERERDIHIMLQYNTPYYNDIIQYKLGGAGRLWGQTGRQAGRLAGRLAGRFDLFPTNTQFGSQQVSSQMRARASLRHSRLPPAVCMQ